MRGEKEQRRACWESRFVPVSMLAEKIGTLPNVHFLSQLQLDCPNPTSMQLQAKCHFGGRAVTGVG